MISLPVDPVVSAVAELLDRREAASARPDLD
jgi:hypothetical protein